MRMQSLLLFTIVAFLVSCGDDFPSHFEGKTAAGVRAVEFQPYESQPAIPFDAANIETLTNLMSTSLPAEDGQLTVDLPCTITLDLNDGARLNIKSTSIGLLVGNVRKGVGVIFELDGHVRQSTNVSELSSVLKRQFTSQNLPVWHPPRIVHLNDPNAVKYASLRKVMGQAMEKWQSGQLEETVELLYAAGQLFPNDSEVMRLHSLASQALLSKKFSSPTPETVFPSGWYAKNDFPARLELLFTLTQSEFNKPSLEVLKRKDLTAHSLKVYNTWYQRREARGKVSDLLNACQENGDADKYFYLLELNNIQYDVMNVEKLFTMMASDQLDDNEFTVGLSKWLRGLAAKYRPQNAVFSEASNLMKASMNKNNAFRGRVFYFNLNTFKKQSYGHYLRLIDDIDTSEATALFKAILINIPSKEDPLRIEMDNRAEEFFNKASFDDARNIFPLLQLIYSKTRLGEGADVLTNAADSFLKRALTADTKGFIKKYADELSVNQRLVLERLPLLIDGLFENGLMLKERELIPSLLLLYTNGDFALVNDELQQSLAAAKNHDDFLYCAELIDWRVFNLENGMETLKTLSSHEHASVRGRALQCLYYAYKEEGDLAQLSDLCMRVLNSENDSHIVSYAGNTYINAGKLGNEYVRRCADLLSHPIYEIRILAFEKMLKTGKGFGWNKPLDPKSKAYSKSKDLKLRKDAISESIKRGYLDKGYLNKLWQM